MKLGQTLSVFEAAVPEEIAAPYREALVKLQEEAPPMPVRTVQPSCPSTRKWRERFRDFDDAPAAAASIGQVHRATWRDGRDVAVKIQYPGAATALMADLNQLARFARLFAALFPGLDVKPLIAELKARVVEELDYGLEADAQRTFAAAYADDPEIVVPRVVASAPKVIVSGWLEAPLSRIIADGTQEQRDRAGHLLAVLHFSGPQRAGLLHADPIPATSGCSPTGGSGSSTSVPRPGCRTAIPSPSAGCCAGRWPARPTRSSPTCARRASSGRTSRWTRRGAGLFRPLLEPVVDRHFHFTRAWMQEQAARIADPRTDGEPARPAAEPSPGLPADPPGDDRVDRCAVPARRQGRLPGRRRGMAPASWNERGRVSDALGSVWTRPRVSSAASGVGPGGSRAGAISARVPGTAVGRGAVAGPQVPSRRRR